MGGSTAVLQGNWTFVWTPTARGPGQSLVERRPRIQRWVDRVRAKLAYHDRRTYRALVARTAGILNPPLAEEALLYLLRRLDSQGLGVWYLSQIEQRYDLVQHCEEMFRDPRCGPPRAVAQLLGYALRGEEVWWVPELGARDAMIGETLISAALVSVLAAVDLASNPKEPSWSTAHAVLACSANVLQAAGRALSRADGQAARHAAAASSRAYQTLNVVRRALNRTVLHRHEQQLSAQAAQLALDTAHTACAAAVELLAAKWNEDRQQRGAADADSRLSSSTGSVRDELILSARRADALAGRVENWLEGDDPRLEERLPELLGQVSQVLSGCCLTLRSRGMRLVGPNVQARSGLLSKLCERTVALSERCRDTLEAWRALASVQAPSQSAPAGSPSPSSAPLAWLKGLRSVACGTWTAQEIAQAIRRLSSTEDEAVAAAVCIAGLPCSSSALDRALWDLIQDSSATAQQRSFAFQLFWRLRC